MSNREIEVSNEELLEIEKELRSLEEKRPPPTTKSRAEKEVTRVSTGIPELDKALEGGVPKGSWVAITGEPGTGK